jgi:beta-fructofuranosidase
MALRLPDKWLWDFWLAQDGPNYHLFYLQAPRSLNEEGLRHWNVSIGHAVSRDLRNWEVLPDALRPSTSSGWDDYTTWTGSILKRNGLWYMLYTAARRADDGLVQRIGRATSPDLLRWEKHPENPLLEPDPCWYDVLDLELWPDQAWRDPFLFRHPDTGDFHAFITGRVNTGPTDGRSSWLSSGPLSRVSPPVVGSRAD